MITLSYSTHFHNWLHSTSLDHRGNVTAQIAYTSMSTRWKYDAEFYAKRVTTEDGVSVDIFFIDTGACSACHFIQFTIADCWMTTFVEKIMDYCDYIFSNFANFWVNYITIC